MKKEYYSPQEIADKLSLSKQTVLSLIKAGKLEAADWGVGKKPVWRVSQESLNKFTHK
jgi:excisionase family DNA binding protein